MILSWIWAMCRCDGQQPTFIDPFILPLLLFSLSVVSSSLQTHRVQHTRLSFSISWSLLKLMCTESVMPSNHLILCCPLLLLSSIFPSIRVFSNESSLRITWLKYWSFSINPSNEYSGLISFRIDWLDLLAVQGTLKSLLQHHSSKALVLWCSALLIASSSNWKKYSFDYTDLFGKVMSLLFNMLARFVIAFLPRSTPLLISWVQSCIYPFRIYWASLMGEILCFKPKLKWCIIDLFKKTRKRGA